jgi:hypothetical protein
VQQGIICVLLTLSLKTDKGQTMKYFGINYFCNHKHHADAIWANDRYELEKQILTMHPNATAIYIWLL